MLEHLEVQRPRIYFLSHSMSTPQKKAAAKEPTTKTEVILSFLEAGDALEEFIKDHPLPDGKWQKFKLFVIHSAEYDRLFKRFETAAFLSYPFIRELLQRLANNSKQS